MLGMGARQEISGGGLPLCSTPWPREMGEQGWGYQGAKSVGQILALVPAIQDCIRWLVQAGTGWPRAESSLQHGGDPPGPLGCC